VKKKTEGEEKEEEEKEEEEEETGLLYLQYLLSLVQWDRNKTKV